MPDSGDSSWELISKDNTVAASVILEAIGKLEMRATNIRRPSTGVHARVGILLNDSELAYDVFNIDRDTARRSLSKSAFEELGPVEKKVIQADYLRSALNRFCARVWPAFTAASGVVEAGSDEEPPEPTFAVKPYIMMGAGTILFAPPGGGKSYTTYLMGTSITTGCCALWECPKRPYLHVNLERSAASVNSRQWYINRALGLPAKQRVRMIHAKGKRLDAIYDQVANAIQADGYEVLSLDSISRAGYGKLTDDDTGNNVVDVLNALCPTWFAIGHSPRADSTHVFGSIMFDAGQDIGVKLTAQASKDGHILGVTLQMVKANDTFYPPLQILAYEFEGYHLKAVRVATAQEFPQLAMAQRIDIGDQLYDFLLGVGSMSATDVAAETGWNRAHMVRLFKDDPRFVVVKKEGKKVLYGVKREG